VRARSFTQAATAVVGMSDPRPRGRTAGVSKASGPRLACFPGSAGRERAEDRRLSTGALPAPVEYERAFMQGLTFMQGLRPSTMRYGKTEARARHGEGSDVG
jgi:hypothetical protein